MTVSPFYHPGWFILQKEQKQTRCQARGGWQWADWGSIMEILGDAFFFPPTWQKAERRPDTSSKFVSTNSCEKWCHFASSLSSSSSSTFFSSPSSTLCYSSSFPSASLVHPLLLCVVLRLPRCLFYYSSSSSSLSSSCTSCFSSFSPFSPLFALFISTSVSCSSSSSHLSFFFPLFYLLFFIFSVSFLFLLFLFFFFLKCSDWGPIIIDAFL